jgi:mitotic spindle assembly checkpoint protein MAD2
VTREKSDKDIMTEIQAIMRQIAASVTFLPNIEEACTFDLLAYTSIDSEVHHSALIAEVKYILKIIRSNTFECVCIDKISLPTQLHCVS